MGRPAQKQLGLKLETKGTWGGARKGAGRKRTSRLAPVDRRSRPELVENQAVHVTWRVLPHVWNMRSQRAFSEMLGGFSAAAELHGTRITRFSVQGNHIHMIVETDGEVALARAMQGLGIRFAKALNRLMGRKGPVFADRYHARPLASPREAWNAIRYVMKNDHVHAARRGGLVAAASRPDDYAVGPEELGDPHALWQALGAPTPPIARPRGWLLRHGWRRGAPGACKLPARKRST